MWVLSVETTPDGKWKLMYVDVDIQVTANIETLE
jgi:hypothetical protein